MEGVGDHLQQRHQQQVAAGVEREMALAEQPRGFVGGITQASTIPSASMNTTAWITSVKIELRSPP